MRTDISQITAVVVIVPVGGMDATRYDGQVRVHEMNHANERCERTYSCDGM